MLDNPAVPEFASHRSYSEFSRRVRLERRYATDIASQAFISTVLATASKRGEPVEAGCVMFRAQMGIKEVENDDGIPPSVDIFAHGRDRMVPKAEFVGQGRCNAAGIAYLYLASSCLVAASELRPWVGQGISIARFRISRGLKLVNLTKGRDEPGITLLRFDELEDPRSITVEKKEAVVWHDINRAFSVPVSRGDAGTEYAPTQLLAEAFRSAGYDGVVYRSCFDEPGFNVALFNVADAEIISCAPYVVKRLAISIDPCGNEWYLK